MNAIAPASKAPHPQATDADLAEVLKRCSPATLEAARAFRACGDRAHVPAIVLGIVERYVERELRSKVRGATDDVRLVEDLGLDSLTMIEMVLLIEEVLRISVSNDELTTLRTLGDVRRFVAGKLTPQIP